MTTTLTMPEVAESVVEGTIARWLKQEGDRVEEYEPLVEVVTDKVSVEIPSPASGVLSKILVAVDQTIPIGAELAHIDEEGGAAVKTAPAPQRPPAAAPAAPASTAAPPARPRDAGGPGLSPLVQRLAEEHGVDVAQVTGTGIAGRVRKQDILEFVARRGAAAPPQAPPRPSAPAQAIATAAGDTELPLSAIRATIARRMVKSTQEVPHAWTSFEADVTGLVALREAAKQQFRQAEGISLTYLPFFIKAVVGALKEHPALNAFWTEERIVIKKEINIGIAVDRDEGLIVPVVRHADEKSIAGLARELHGLIERARENKLKLEDVQGGTFTLNNTGTLGTIISKPIVNQPQAAILATEAIVKRPVVVGDGIAIRSMMHISCSFDHRVVDGGQVARFLQAVKKGLEAYDPETPVY